MPGKRKIAATKGHSGATGTTGCVFCFSDEAEKEEIFGKYIKTDTICVHSNCLYFASGLSQRGNDSDELLGFLLPDIQAEVRRGRKLSCAYCKKRGATVGCNVIACRKSFHLNCGMDNASLHQFYGNFHSYCNNHKPRQPDNVKSISCCICRELITRDDMDFCLYPPCCKQGLFHKTCIQKTALNAGWYYFKCPLCRNKKIFVNEMQFYGINIPIQDASWERDEGAYNELLVKPECDAPFCKCPQGRSHCPANKSTWGLLVCSDCGFHARHKPCDNLMKSESTWMCEECSDMNDKISKANLRGSSRDLPGSSRDLPGPAPDLPESATNNINMSPKVVLQKIEEIPSIYCDSLSYSGSPKPELYRSKVTYAKTSKSSLSYSGSPKPELYRSKVTYAKTSKSSLSYSGSPKPELYRSKVTYAKTSKSIDSSKAVKSGNGVSSETVPVAGSSKHLTNRLPADPATNEVKNSFQIPVTSSKLFDHLVYFKDIKNLTHSPFKQKSNIKTKLSKKVCKKLKVDNQSSGISGQALITSYFGHNNEKNIRL